MSVYAGQSAEPAIVGRSPKPQRPAPLSPEPALAARLSGKQRAVIPADPRVGTGPSGVTGRFSPAVLPMPTFGKSYAGYHPSMPRFLSASDDQHANPAGVAGPARTSGSTDA